MTDSDKLSPKEILSKYELDEIDKRILQLKANYPRITNREIGDVVGIERRTVGARINKPKFQEALAQLALPASEIFQTNLEKIARKYVRLTESTNETIAERVMREILITHGVLKPHGPTGEGNGAEPMVIELPSRGKTIEVRNVRVLPEGKT